MSRLTFSRSGYQEDFWSGSIQMLIMPGGFSPHRAARNCLGSSIAALLMCAGEWACCGGAW